MIARIGRPMNMRRIAAAPSPPQTRRPRPRAAPATRGSIGVRLDAKIHAPLVQIDSTAPRAELGYRSPLAAGRYEVELAEARWLEGINRRVSAGQALLPDGSGEPAAVVIADLAAAEAAAPIHRGVTIDILPQSRPEVTLAGGELVTTVNLQTALGIVQYQSERRWR